MRSIALLLFTVACTAAAQTSPWQMEHSGATASLRGVHAVGGGVVWASGTGGTVLRSEDSGFEWQSCAMPPGAEKLDFRAIWAWDANTAIAMSSGPGDLSRLYKTTDGCAHWTLLYTNPDKNGFWDALVFQNRKRGFLLGDPVNGLFTFMKTEDGGVNWQRSEASGLAPAKAGDGVFAASNSSLLAGPRDPVLFGTGGAGVYAQSFVFKLPKVIPPGATVNLPMHEVWTRVPLPMAHDGESAGVFSLGYHEGPVKGYSEELVAVGGDYEHPEDRSGTAAWSEDPRHWTASATPPGGYRSAVAYDPALKAWITVGPNGSDLSRDDGRTWQSIEHAPANAPKAGEWNALSLPWVVGPNGRIAKLNPAMLPLAPKITTQEKPKVTPR